MQSYQGVACFSLLLTAMVAIGPPASAAQSKAKTAVLVHGAFADGSSWEKVIPYLEKAGLKVVAVQNPLDSLDNDVAATTACSSGERSAAKYLLMPSSLIVR